MNTGPNDTKRVEYQHTERGVVPVYADQIVEQPTQYAAEDHRTWGILLHRQRQHIVGKAADAFVQALDAMPFDAACIPRFSDINSVLQAATGWNIVAVNGLLSDGAFFDLLARRRFPVTWWIRKPSQIDYIQEPDLFHDLFGHVPLLAHEDYAQVMQEFGRVGATSLQENPSFTERLARMYWFSVEFGLMQHANDSGTNDSVRAFGAGLLSSGGEIDHALSADPAHKKFRMHDVIRTAYKIDAYQPIYFVLPDFAHIHKELAAYVRMYRHA